MEKVRTAGSGSRGRFSKSDWLAAALDVLADGGIEAVRVERLAKQLGVAKSGFYYHFRDRDDLHAELLLYWLNLDKLPIERSRDAAEKPASERLLLIAETIEDANLSRYDMAVRLWARQSAQVRRTWRKEMSRRLDLVRGLFAELGFSGDDLEARTRLYAAYQVTGSQVFEDLSTEARNRLRKHQIALLTARS